MATVKFDPQALTIAVSVFLKASHPIIAKFALDTGASQVSIPWKLASSIGLFVDHNQTTQITTVTQVETVPKVVIPEVSVLGKTVKNVEAIVKDLPPESPVDGLLGLSFLKYFKLTVDFKKGNLSLE